MDSDDALHELLNDFQRTVAVDVRPPGAESVRRTVMRRQRVRTRAIATLAVVTLAGAATSYFVSHPRHDEQPVGPDTTASAPASGAPLPLPGTPNATGTAPSRTTASANAPTPNRPSASASARVTGPAPTGPTDLRATAPGTAVLVPTAGAYQGAVSVTVNNSGAPYAQTYLIFTLPEGITVSGPGIGPCGGATPPESTTCYGGGSVPGYGGQTTFQLTIHADFAPQPSDWSISGFAVRVAPATNAATWIVDPTPENNRATMTLGLRTG